VLGTEMKYLNNKKNNSIVTAASLFTVGTVIVVVAIGIITMAPLTALAAVSGHPVVDTKAPSVVSGDNIYIAWWTNNTEN